MLQSTNSAKPLSSRRVDSQDDIQAGDIFDGGSGGESLTSNEFIVYG
ncbi:MAG: hypothetical protein RIC87_19085 [Kiloniellales bacterium]